LAKENGLTPKFLHHSSHQPEVKADAKSQNWRQPEHKKHGSIYSAGKPKKAVFTTLMWPGKNPYGSNSVASRYMLLRFFDRVSDFPSMGGCI
jgi:hypothetical protein